METNPNPWLNDNASHVSPAGETSPDTSRYVLTIEEASQLFAEAGVPRAPRSITRFCALGDLECIRVDTEKNYKYLIDRNSVEKRIVQLKQTLRFTNKTSPDMSRHVQPNNETSLDMSRHDEKQRETEQPSEKAQLLRERVEELEDENLQLKIDKQARERVIKQMNEERKEIFNQLQDMSFRLGAATTKLEQLEAPRPAPQSSHVQTAGETAPREAEVVTEPPAPQPTPEPTPAPEPSPTPIPAAPEKERGFFSRLFNSK